jgi:phosphate-selective porin OprO/OprP
MAVILCFGVVAVVGVAGTAIAQDGMENRLRALEERLQQQDEEIQRLRGALAEQQEASESLETEMDRYLGKVEDAAWWQEPNTLRAYYKTGLNLETQDGKFHLKIGGRVMFDVAHFDYDGKEIEGYNPNPNDDKALQAEFRRVRFFMEGDVYGNVFYKVQIDFAGSDLAFKDVFLGISGIPFIGNFRVGNQKEPFGLEVLTSSKYITFIDRSLPTNFAPERNAGFQIYNSAMEERIFWALGVFSAGDHRDQAPMGNAITARVAGLVYYENKGEQLVHVGVAYSWRDCKSLVDSYSLRPTHMANKLLSSGTIGDATSQMLLGAELLAIWGQFSLQAEYMMTQWDSKGYDDPQLWGFYAYLSFFVTGEHRSYKGGALGRVKPLANFDMDGGMGAIEFAIRYAMMEFDDLPQFKNVMSGYAEGGQSDITVAVNWYLNPNTRIMLNYMIAYLEGVDNQVTIIIIRFQIDF